MALQKMGISSQMFIEKIITELEKLPKATASTQTLLLRLHLNSVVTDQLHNKGQNLGNLPCRLLRRLAENHAKLIADEPLYLPWQIWGVNSQ